MPDDKKKPQTQSRVDGLLFEKERKSLKLLSIWRIIILLTMLISSFFISIVFLEKILVALITSSSIAINILGLVFLNKKKYISYVGIGGALTDSILLISLPIIWYLSAGGPDLPYVYLAKTSVTVICLLAIIMNGLSLRPLYPILVTVTSSLIHITILILIVYDPRTIYSQNWKEIMLSPATNIGFLVTYLQVVMGSGVIVALICRSARKIVYEGVRLEVANTQLGRYFSPNLVEELTKSDEALLSPGGKIQKVAVLFSDIRGFTSLSEKMHPAEVLQFLSEYHEIVVGVIFKYGGTLDKFIGDAVMATFGTPVAKKEDVLNAVQAAKEINKDLEKFNQNRKKSGLPEIQHGIGIHYGDVLVGNIGTKERLEYTVIGDTVNTANRIESACKELEKSLLFSEVVAEEIRGKLPLTYVDTVSVKGKIQELRLFTLEQKLC